MSKKNNPCDILASTYQSLLSEPPANKFQRDELSTTPYSYEPDHHQSKLYEVKPVITVLLKNLFSQPPRK